MTTSTQAQIEAARKMLQLSSCFGREVCPVLPCACAETMAALTAAAEAGITVGDTQQLAMIENYRDKIATIKVDTIERCVQKLDELAKIEEESGNAYSAVIYERAAAAIRALKDQP